jgi:hypothetical protein
MKPSTATTTTTTTATTTTKRGSEETELADAVVVYIMTMRKKV